MEWTPKEHVAGYIVLYMRSGIRDIVPKVVHNISEPRVMIGSLEADTKYNFQVAAVSQHGSGPFSKPKGFQTFAKSKKEEVKRYMEQVLQEEIPKEIQEEIQARLQPENFATAMCNAGFVSVDRASDFGSIMSAVKDDITSQSTEEMITEKFNKFVILLHENLEQQHFARDLTEKLCNVMPDYESPLNSALMEVMGIFEDIKRQLIARPVDKKVFGEAMYKAGFISEEAMDEASKISGYYKFIMKIMSDVEVHLTSQSTEKLEERLCSFIKVLTGPEVTVDGDGQGATSRRPEGSGQVETQRAVHVGENIQMESSHAVTLDHPRQGIFGVIVQKDLCAVPQDQEKDNVSSRSVLCNVTDPLNEGFEKTECAFVFTSMYVMPTQASNLKRKSRSEDGYSSDVMDIEIICMDSTCLPDDNKTTPDPKFQHAGPDEHTFPLKGGQNTGQLVGAKDYVHVAQEQENILMKCKCIRRRLCQ